MRGCYLGTCPCCEITRGHFKVYDDRQSPKVCPAGTASEVGCYSSCACCKTYPFGTSRSDGEDSTQCLAAACLGGYWWESTVRLIDEGFRSVTKGLCAKCPEGRFVLNGTGRSLEDCLPCAPGTFGGGLNCTHCPLGRYSAAAEAKDSGACAPCSVGKYTPATASTACTWCPAGTYAPEQGTGTCLPCEPGSSSGVGSVACQPCRAGAFCPNGLPLPCPRGSFSSTEGATSPETCLLCGPGRYAPEVGGTSSFACLPCPPGQFAAGNGSGVCDLCPPGTSSTRLGATSNTSCTPCARGTFASDPGTSGSCPLECPSGWAARAEGGSSLTQACQPCRPGTFAATFRSLECTPASPGYFVEGPLAISQTPCPPGTGSQAGAASLQACRSSAADDAAAAPLSTWEQVKAWVLPALSLLGFLVTYTLFGDRLFATCAPGAHALMWRAVAGGLAGTLAAACCCVRGRAWTMSLAAAILRRNEELQEEREKHTAAVLELMKRGVAPPLTPPTLTPRESVLQGHAEAPDEGGPMHAQTLNPLRAAQTAAH